MSEIAFDTAFKILSGNDPFPWQRELYRRFISDGEDNIPPSCNLPTGLGKTSVIHVWLIALATNPSTIPRRLVYVVNRRTVVDQSTREAEKVRERLKDVPLVAAALRQLCAVPSDPPLAISTLRGQLADNEQWSFDPARPAVVVGTVDMIGSRLLFSGYGLRRYDRAHQVGLIGHDALIVHDEAHLTHPFQKLLTAIVREQRGRERDHGAALRDRCLRVMELTATSRTDAPPAFTLTPDDERHPVVRERLDARKTLTLHPVSAGGKRADTAIVPCIVKLAARHKDSSRPILVFVQTPQQVREVARGLTGRPHNIPVNRICTLTGTMRGRERDELPNNEVFAKFMSDPPVRCVSDTAYLICTSAGEVGIDISADHLVCDLATFESMAQRFGRVNRRGGIDPLTAEARHAAIDVVHETPIDESNHQGERRERTRKLLQQLIDEHAGSASPDTLRLRLTDTDKQAAFAPPVPTLPATDILFDAWALTTVTEDLPGRPEVADWLHGVEPSDQPETWLAWRGEVAELAPKDGASTEELAERAKEIAEHLGRYPLKPHELLRDRTVALISQHLPVFARRGADRPAWLIDPRGNVRLLTVGDLTDLDVRDLIDRQIVLPPEVGGLARSGMLEEEEGFDAGREYDVADAAAGRTNQTPRPRIRLVWAVDDEGKENWRALGSTQAFEIPDELKATGQMKGYARLPDVVLKTDAEGEPTRLLAAFVADPEDAGEEDRSRRGRFQQDLADHLNAAEAHAEALAARLLPDDLRRAVRFAAKWHDLGKNRKVWQDGVGNFRRPGDLDWRPWAKSGRRGRILGLNDYRHEFGSLLDLFDKRKPFRAEFEQRLSPHEQELVLHLIAAHHGRARPHFPAEETIDSESVYAVAPAVARTMPRRFAQLQRRYGRWGLAYLESLVRAADILASQPTKEGKP